MKTLTHAVVARLIRAGRYDLAVVVAGLSFEEAGPSPLKYPRSGNVQRLLLRDSSVTTPPGRHDYYFADTFRTRTKTGRKLKKPKLDQPGIKDVSVVGFLDYHEYSNRSYYLDYLKTREDARGKGHARALVEQFYRTHKPAAVHWGRMMAPEIGKLFESMKKKFPKVNTSGHVYYDDD